MRFYSLTDLTITAWSQGLFRPPNWDDAGQQWQHARSSACNSIGHLHRARLAPRTPSDTARSAMEHFDQETGTYVL